MRRAVALLGLFGVVAAGISLSVLPATKTTAASNEPRTFLIPASDGYGVADCISTASECGKIVANAWCEAQGFGKAVAFGVADRADFTGTVRKPVAAVSQQPLTITCGQ
ncbi:MULTISPECIES: hypothetical protein [unclassified Bosea (in: a-proteobacteria)]|uniref:hypothetical protein n=1 Tax=unclassified Bosea (in: a-proteobacteria) TaxID=2653178 RepID=UPI000954812A|nr:MULTISPECIES: hypothetical protein [unclassified Bosea (in: a-proteobacteria)]TAJ26892.1 MAG: hypothetical protein EPO59_23720 [Bosea sp. (in: a-proteobacteria)]SIP99063.1 hypothetical protein SAMN05880592_101467 [Bosea sp. TND4EK4]